VGNEDTKNRTEIRNSVSTRQRKREYSLKNREIAQRTLEKEKKKERRLNSKKERN
jgi:hypothetical protein